MGQDSGKKGGKWERTNNVQILIFGQEESPEPPFENPPGGHFRFGTDLQIWIPDLGNPRTGILGGLPVFRDPQNLESGIWGPGQNPQNPQKAKYLEKPLLNQPLCHFS